MVKGKKQQQKKKTERTIVETGEKKKINFHLHIITYDSEEIKMSNFHHKKQNLKRSRHNTTKVCTRKHYILFKSLDSICNHNKLKTYLVKCYPPCDFENYMNNTSL